MRCPITAALVALVVIGGLVVPVQGGKISGTFSGDATLTTQTPGVFVENFTGDGNDTTFGSFNPHSTSTIDFSKPPAVTISGGMLSETFTQMPFQGTLFGTTSGSGAANGHGTATFMAEFVITGGTGYFAGATGEATLTGTITIKSSTTASVTGSYVGTLSIPEPSTLALFAPAVAVGAVVVVRGRRREAMAR